MLATYENCSSTKVFQEELETEDFDESITYSQWVTTDRPTLLNATEQYSDFFEKNPAQNNTDLTVG